MNSKFSTPRLLEMYGRQCRELIFRFGRDPVYLTIKAELRHFFPFRISFPSFAIVILTGINLLGHEYDIVVFFFLQVPSCLILQMPRFGNRYKMYDMILPNLELDVTHIVENGACNRDLTSILSESPFDDLTSSIRVATKKKKGGKECFVLQYEIIFAPVFKMRNLAGKTPEHQ